MNKLTEAREKANRRWDNKNRDRKRYLNKRSTAKSFILKDATEEDLETILEYVEKRKADLKNSSSN